jgi:ribonuclease HII
MGKEINNTKYEENLNVYGIYNIVGTDEAGRGPLFGPVVAAAVYIPNDFDTTNITDSKKLTSKKREELYERIINNCKYSVSIMDSDVIDEVNIYEASRKAMEEAVLKLNKEMKVEHILVDAMPLKLDIPSTSIVKGDMLSVSIGAASIVAKVTRDKIMEEYDKKYPEYEFSKHKGYPTKRHLELLKKYGYIKGYRKTYKPVSEVLNGSK